MYFRLDFISMKALVVDDSSFMRRVLINTIRSTGLFKQIDACSNVDDAIEMYKMNRPDLVSMDLMLPKKTGIEAIKKIIDYDMDASIIVCSSLEQNALIATAIDCGARDFVGKPFKPEIYAEKVRNLMVRK